MYKIIVGEEKCTDGSIYLNGDKCEGMCIDIGYCPQIDCFEKRLTVKNNLYLFGRLKGINPSEIDHLIKLISKLFLLDLYLDNSFDELSGGTKRRVHSALSCLSNPSIILLGLFFSLSFFLYSLLFCFR